MSWTGTLDFDDVRMSSVQPASRLKLEASTAVQSFGCGTLEVSLLTSSNTAAAAPYPVVAQLSSIPSGGVDFFTDATCTTPAAGGEVTLPTDATSMTVSFCAVPFKEAKDRLVNAFERDYLKHLLDAANGNITHAADAAGITRVYLQRLMKKHRLQGRG